VLAARLVEAYRLISDLTAQIQRLSARVEQLERQAGKDSSTSSRPPSSDSPYKKKGSDRSLRERGKRRPGKQPGGPGMTMNLVDDPGETIDCPPAACCGCGADLASAPVTAQRRHQVTDIVPAPAPKITEYVAQAKECAGCGTVTARELPAHVRARAVYRRKISRQLNKGESLHALRRDLHYAQQGTIVRPHLQDQTEQAWCLTLLTNSVICWTTWPAPTGRESPLRVSVVPVRSCRQWVSDDPGGSLRGGDGDHPERQDQRVQGEVAVKHPG
jgi:hypothetical protein